MGTAETLMTWADVPADPTLQNLPYKIELNKDGKIVMSPAGNNYGMHQAEIVTELGARQHGKASVEGSVRVDDGAVVVADVVWMSDERMALHGAPDPMSVAPEICVEVVSPSNSKAEMVRKVAQYLRAGAHEVWVVDIEGGRTVHKR